MVWRSNLNDVSSMIAGAVSKAVAAEMAPMHVTIAQLKESTTGTTARMETMMANYATRADVAQLRQEMHDMAAQFMPKALSDQRYDELQRSMKARDEEIERRFKAVETRQDAQSTRGFSVGVNAVMWVIGGIGLLITLGSATIALIALFHK